MMKIKSIFKSVALFVGGAIGSVAMMLGHLEEISEFFYSQLDPLVPFVSSRIDEIEVNDEDQNGDKDTIKSIVLRSIDESIQVQRIVSRAIVIHYLGRGEYEEKLIEQVIYPSDLRIHLSKIISEVKGECIRSYYEIEYYNEVRNVECDGEYPIVLETDLINNKHVETDRALYILKYIVRFSEKYLEGSSNYHYPSITFTADYVDVQNFRIIRRISRWEDYKEVLRKYRREHMLGLVLDGEPYVEVVE